MTLAQLLAMFRARAGDREDPPLFSDEFLIPLANEAEREACRRGRLIIDSSTVDDGADPPVPVCSIAVTAGDEYLELHPAVLFIKRLRLTTANKRIPRVAARDLDTCYPNWEAESGDILAYCPDHQSGKLRWFRKPEADDTATLTVIRLPLAEMEALSDKPELPARFHERLVDYMLWLAYQVDDTETIDPKMADKALLRFEEEFGGKSAASNEQYLQTEYDFGGLDGVY